LAAQHQQASPPIDGRARLRAITEARPPYAPQRRQSALMRHEKIKESRMK
jgi:hypothetical protein